MTHFSYIEPKHIQNPSTFSHSRLIMLKDHLSKWGDLFLSFGSPSIRKRVAQIELRSSSNDCVFLRLEGETKHIEVNMFNIEFEFTNLPSAESYCKHIESKNSESDWNFDDDYRKARKIIQDENEAENAYFKSHPELNP